MDVAVLVEGDQRRRLAAVAEAIRAAETPWTVRSYASLSPGPFAERPSLVVVLGPADAALAIAASLEAATVVLAIVDEPGDEPGDPERIARTLEAPDRCLIVTAGFTERILEKLAAALRGGAYDPRCGAVSLASLAHALAGFPHAVRLPPARRDAPWFYPASLERMWLLGWSTTGSTTLPHRATSSPGDALLGTMLPGRFRIDAVIASGSFGVVYRGRQLSVGRAVAIKVLHAGIEPFSEDGRLFVQEIQAVARIDHPNVVRVYQADITADRRLFFAMELLEGTDLQAHLGAGPLAVPRAIALFTQLVAALDAAHRVGIVHADVKPGNAIVVASEGAERLVLVDFGLARLRTDEAVSVGGTPAFMAPEQLREGHVSPRSDQFSAALVLVAMLTGWRRSTASALTPPEATLAQIADPQIRAALARALAIDPDARFGSVLELGAALVGEAVASAPTPRRPPFHGLASLTEADHDHLHGREQALARLTELLFHRGTVIVTAASGVGKTSLLRAGLLGRLSALGTTPFYTSCRDLTELRWAAQLDAGATSLAEGLARWRGQDIALVVDQVEDALEHAERARLLGHVVSDATPTGSTRVVLAVREDFLARLLDQLPDRGDGIAIMRVGPLDGEGARAAIERPLLEARLAIEPALLDRLVEDLVEAGTALAAELGWATPRPVYPPHLQLVCTVLYDQLPHGSHTLTLAHYVACGGFAAIVGKHLDRVLGELSARDHAVAREVLLALVGPRNLRVTRTEDELRAYLPAAQAPHLDRVLELLRREGLLVRVRRPSGELAWEIIHDSVIPRVLAWLDQHDVARRHAIEIVRHHLRRDDPHAILSRQELREVEAHPNLVDVLAREWDARPAEADGPRSLVARSRRHHRRARVRTAAVAALVVAGLGFAAYQRWRVDVETSLRDRNMGHLELQLVAFDWDPQAQRAREVPLDELPALTWRLHRPAAVDPDLPGDLLPYHAEPPTQRDLHHRAYAVEAQGGRAVLVIAGRGRPGESCAPSILPIANLPGYAERGKPHPPHLVRVPTCRATRAGTVLVPAGPFVFGGLGEPPPGDPVPAARRTERRIDLPAFRIDATEVTNAAFAELAQLAPLTGISRRERLVPARLDDVDAPALPATQITWREARAYCRYLGKDLVTSEQWEKALRGGELLADGPNPHPRRNFPWGISSTGLEANLRRGGEQPPRAVGSCKGDVSPYAVYDLAGNVMEWMRSPVTGVDAEVFFRGTTRMVRGGNSFETPPEELASYLVLENTREGDGRSLTVGWRCSF